MAAHGHRIVTPFLLAGLAAAAAVPPPVTPVPLPPGIAITQLSFRSRVIVRVQTTVIPVQPVELVEKKGPRCVPVTAILAAAVLAENSVDFILRGGQRVRARFSRSCPALGFYRGFYMAPGPDGLVCADRDAVRSRAGGECQIDRLRLLMPAPPR